MAGEIGAKMHKNRFLALYIGLGLVAFMATLAFGMVLTLPKPEVHKADVAAVKAEVQASLGEQDVAKLCEANITTTVIDNGGQVRKLKTTAVKVTKNTAIVKLSLDSTIYTGSLTCTLQRSTWTIQGVQ